MNLPILQSEVKTMSSREIADLCGARHNDVITTIERLFSKGLLRESRKTLRKSLRNFRSEKPKWHRISGLRTDY